MTRTLSAPVTVAFDYTRSTGPVLGKFLTGLRDGRLVAGRTSEGRVVLPPPEFDPVTHDAVTDFVEVAPTGTVTSWTWVSEPVAAQPLDRPFAFALVTLDGADVPFLRPSLRPMLGVEGSSRYECFRSRKTTYFISTADAA